MGKKIPRGWVDYKPYGDKVEGTNLLPFKTPLKQELVEHRVPKEQWFTPALLMDNCPQLKAIIDLTDTDHRADRYYSPHEFLDLNVEHLKLRIPGGGLVPGPELIRKFSDAVEAFVRKFSGEPDALIGVHCTHGLNRTGYFICKYMVTRMSCEPGDAIAKFHKARGYDMYRQNFIEEILTPGVHSDKPQIPDFRRHPRATRPVEARRHARTTRPVDTTRPVETTRPVDGQRDTTNNWRTRNPRSPEPPEPGWRSFSKKQRWKQDRNPAASGSNERFGRYDRNRDVARRDMEYRSPLDDGYEDSCRRNTFPGNRNRRT